MTPLSPPTTLRAGHAARVAPGLVLSRLASFALVSMLLASAATASELHLRWQSAAGEVLAERMVSLEDLDRMPRVSLETSTPWTEGNILFSGTALGDLAALAPLGEVASADLTALNDYVATVPAEDWREMTLVLADRMNGKTMPVYEKGPFWLVYPVDQLERPLPQAYVARMIWQVASITFHVR